MPVEPRRRSVILHFQFDLVDLQFMHELLNILRRKSGYVFCIRNLATEQFLGSLTSDPLISL